MTINAADLWYVDPDTCHCDEDYIPNCLCSNGGWSFRIYRGSLPGSGRLFVTDPHVGLYVDVLDVPPTMPAPEIMSSNQLRHFAKILLLCPILDRIPDALFPDETVGLLEDAGYRVRALDGIRTQIPDPPYTHSHIHGIVNDAGAVVGLVSALEQRLVHGAVGRNPAR